jgi:MFS family permease
VALDKLAMRKNASYSALDNAEEAREAPSPPKKPPVQPGRKPTEPAAAKPGDAPKKKGPTDPRCNLYRKENMAITMSYFSVGLVMSLIQTPLNVYMVEVLDAEPSLQNTIAILQTLPWSLKLVFGFLSDSVPICEMQRKPYLLIGTLVYSAAFITYGMCGINNTPFLALCVFMGTLGLIMVDVVADTMCVQRSRFEKEDHKGHMQASFYSVRFAGGLAGAITGAVVSNRSLGLTFHDVSLAIGLVPFLLIMPWIYV